MLLSTLSLSSAGFARLWDFLFGDLPCDGFWPFFIEFYLAADLLVLALGLHDLARHRRLHPAWRAFAPALIGH